MKIAVLVSGGVDSSVALALLKKQGHEVTAFYLKIWLDDELAFLGECPWQDDLNYVQQVCHQLEVPLHIVPMQEAYRDRIVAYTIAQVKKGCTPNPDVLCNQYIKFGLFLDTIDPSFERVATGHYAQMKNHNGTKLLELSPDAIKDQTYFLCRLSAQQRKRCMFPIGHLTKSHVRALAQEFDLPNKDRKDSQGICFLGKFKFKDFIKCHLGEQEGVLVEYETGTVVGTHPGFWFYTIGQRHGIKLAGGPWYVVAKNVEQNRVYISRSYYEQHQERKNLLVTECQWFDKNEQLSEKKILVKLRHGAHMHEATLILLDLTTCNVILKENDQGIAAGQFAVFYDGVLCIGSGVIT
jgi:tRNA-5-taurinomethyluridine 2-sulfurtransferase